MRVLVIDDEEGIRAVFRDFLEALGYEADVAAGGEEGLALFDRHRHGLVLTDLLMPGMSGLEVARAIRARCPETPIVVISGSADALDRERIEASGFTFLAKPVGFPEFMNAVTVDRRGKRCAGSFTRGGQGPPRTPPADGPLSPDGAGFMRDA
ncbi:MAG: response regulator [Candidatus Rokubacteria bacterium]|nr:response regulator [Candidatus Rokubacteria bacterium]